MFPFHKIQRLLLSPALNFSFSPCATCWQLLSLDHQGPDGDKTEITRGVVFVRPLGCSKLTLTRTLNWTKRGCCLTRHKHTETQKRLIHYDPNTERIKGTRKRNSGVFINFSSSEKTALLVSVAASFLFDKNPSTGESCVSFQGLLDCQLITLHFSWFAQISMDKEARGSDCSKLLWENHRTRGRTSNSDFKINLAHPSFHPLQKTATQSFCNQSKKHGRRPGSRSNYQL